LPKWRAAAECIDWTIPCPSIFERKRPLADATLRRIARGVMRYVVNAAEPFIVPVSHQGDARAHPIDEPLRTVTGAHRGEHALVTPFVARIGQTGGNGAYANDLRDPITTITSKAEHLLVSPTLINTRNGERDGQAPRVRDVGEPYPTITAQGSQGALVAAFLAKHYGGHETPGSSPAAPLDTITATDHHALVASHLVKLRGTNTGQDVRDPLQTISAQGTHFAEVRAFLIKFYGEGGQWSSPRDPLHTISTKDRMGLVTVHGEEYAIVDIGMRMLTPRELFLAQGFRPDYRIDIEFDGKPLTKTAQVRMCGNSVSPPCAEATVRANVVDIDEREVA
jgi:DNA (cytosine-5)-methyltransferase 1